MPYYPPGEVGYGTVTSIVAGNGLTGGTITTTGTIAVGQGTGITVNSGDVANAGVLSVAAGTGMSVSGTGSGPYTGAVTVNTVQDIATTASPTFTGGTFTSSVSIAGNLSVTGTTFVVEPVTVLVADNHLYMNAGYTVAAGQTGGLVVNYLPIATTDTVATGGFTAGVASTSNPTVITTGSGTFSVGQLIQIDSANNVSDDGLFEVLSHVGTTLSIRGVGLTGVVEDFTQTDFTTNATVAGNIRRVTVSVLRAGTDGLWEVGSGSTTGFTFGNLYYVGGADVGPLDGGTGLSTVTTGDILYGSATNTWAALADVAVGSVLVAGGVGVAPAWSTTPQVARIGIGAAADAAQLFTLSAPSTLTSGNAVRIGWGAAVTLDGTTYGSFLDQRTNVSTASAGIVTAYYVQMPGGTVTSGSTATGFEANFVAGSAYHAAEYGFRTTGTAWANPGYGFAATHTYAGGSPYAFYSAPVFSATVPTTFYHYYVKEATGTAATTMYGLYIESLRNATNCFGVYALPSGIANGVGAVTTTATAFFDAATVSLGNQTATVTNLNSLRIEQATYTSTTLVRTVTNPSTVYIAGPPIASTNVTFANTGLSLYVDAGTSRFDTAQTVASTGGATLDAFSVPADTITITGTTAITTAAGFNLVNIGTPTYTDGSAVTITRAATLSVAGAPTVDGSVTITTAVSAQFGAATTQVSAAGLIYRAVDIPVHTLTITGTTQVTSVGPAGLGIGVLTITDGSAVTVDNASALYIAGPPVAAGSVTLSNSYSLWVDAGNVRIDGSLTDGTVTFALNTIYRSSGTDVALADGGLSASLTASNGGIFYSTSTAGAILAGTATAGQLLLSGASAAPTWSTTTYPATNAISTLLYASSANVMAALATANSGVLVTSGTGVPSIATDIPAAVTIGTAYIYRVGGTDVSLVDGGTNASLTAVSGGVVYSTASALAISAAGSSGQILISAGAATPVWSTTTYPSTNAINTLLYASAANVMSALATANNSVLVTGSTGTPTILADPNVSGKHLESVFESTPVWSTITWPLTGAANTILFFNATNAVSAISAAASRVLVTSGTNVPSLSTDIPTAVTIGTAYIYRVGGTDVSVADGGTGGSSASITLFNNITGYSAAGATGTTSTNLVFSTSPTLVTPVLGAASATSLACATFTSSGAITITPAAGSTVTIDGGALTADLSAVDAIVVGNGTTNCINSTSTARLTTGGVWTDAPSYRRYKNRVRGIGNVLDRIMTLDVDVWEYKPGEINGVTRRTKAEEGVVHCSPYLDDFYGAFGLGDGTGVVPMDYVGVLFNAIKELKAENDSLRVEIAVLQDRK